MLKRIQNRLVLDCLALLRVSVANASLAIFACSLSAQEPLSFAEPVSIRPAGIYSFQPNDFSEEAEVYSGGTTVQVLAAEAVYLGQAGQIDERTAARLSLLQRPISDIDFERAPEAERTPVTTTLTTKLPFVVTQAAHPSLPQRRYAIAARHNPLYFEELNLERCGNALGFAQPLVSAATFFGNVAMLPYRVGTRPWCKVEYDRLECQSGGRLPCTEPLQPSFKGFATQLTIAAGITALLL